MPDIEGVCDISIFYQPDLGVMSFCQTGPARNTKSLIVELYELNPHIMPISVLQAESSYPRKRCLAYACDDNEA